MNARSDQQLRIGDAERERAQSALGEHYAAGRLDHEEYVERLDRIWEARTGADLAPLFTDLPGPGAPGPGAPAYSTPAQRRPAGRPRRRPARPPLPLLVLLGLLLTVAVVTHLPWILIGLGVWFFFLRGGACSAGRRARHW